MGEVHEEQDVQSSVLPPQEVPEEPQVPCPDDGKEESVLDKEKESRLLEEEEGLLEALLQIQEVQGQVPVHEKQEVQEGLLCQEKGRLQEALLQERKMQEDVLVHEKQEVQKGVLCKEEGCPYEMHEEQEVSCSLLAAQEVHAEQKVPHSVLPYYPLPEVHEEQEVPR